MTSTSFFRYITPTDVDRFIQICEEIQVDFATPIVISEDVMSTWDCTCFNNDYAVYCEVPKDLFFDTSGMQWRYEVQPSCHCDIAPPANGGLYLGPDAVDAGVGSQRVVRDRDLWLYLANTDFTSRFVHMRQCNRFFKYSFAVGERTQVTSRDGIVHDCQLFGVFICPYTGNALPYAISVPVSQVFPELARPDPSGYTGDCCGDTLLGHVPQFPHATGPYIVGENDTCGFSMTPLEATEPEVLVFFYADLPETDPSGGRLFERPRVNGLNLEVACPPHPDFIAYGALAHRYEADGCTLALRDPPDQGVDRFDPRQFVNYRCATGSEERCLILYYVVNPERPCPHLGERIYGAFRSHLQLPARDFINHCEDGAYAAGGHDPSGHVLGPHDRFSLKPSRAEVHGHICGLPNVTPPPHIFPINTYHRLDLIDPPPNAAQLMTIEPPTPRLYYPISTVVVSDGFDPSGGVPLDSLATYPIPFDFETPNLIRTWDVQCINLGVRLMQLASNYILDGSTPTELAVFPRLKNESSLLIRSLVSGISAHFQQSSDVRNSVIDQIIKRYGRRYFSEYAVLNYGAWGNMSDVLQRINELFLMFTVTLIFVMRTDTRDAVDRFAIRKVPVIFRLQ